MARYEELGVPAQISLARPPRAWRIPRRGNAGLAEEMLAKEEHAERMRSGWRSYGSIPSGGEHGGEHNAHSAGVPVTPAEEREGAQILEIGTRRH